MNPVLNLIMQSLSEGKEKVITGISKYRNKAFLEATIASAMYIAMADGRISPEEKSKLFSYINQADELNVFSSDDVIAVYKDIIKYYEFDKKMGDAETLRIIAQMKSEDEEQTVFIVRAACVIAMKNGVLSDQEKEAVHKICTELGLPLEKVQL